MGSSFDNGLGSVETRPDLRHHEPPRHAAWDESEGIADLERETALQTALPWTPSGRPQESPANGSKRHRFHPSTGPTTKGIADGDIPRRRPTRPRRVHRRATRLRVERAGESAVVFFDSVERSAQDPLVWGAGASPLALFAVRPRRETPAPGDEGQGAQPGLIGMRPSREHDLVRPGVRLQLLETLSHRGRVADHMCRHGLFNERPLGGRERVLGRFLRGGQRTQATRP